MGDDTHMYYASHISTDTSLAGTVLPKDVENLLNNLANGFGVYRGVSRHELRPLLCSDKLPDFLGISPEDFFTHMSKSNNYGIHPEDLERAKLTFAEAIKDKRSARDIFRLKTGSGEYRYATVFANANIDPDGSFTLYCVFSDAEEEEHVRHIQENRRRIFKKKRARAAETDTAFIQLNITKNTCVDFYHKSEPVTSVNYTDSADIFLKELSANIPDDAIRAEYLRLFSFESFEKDMDEGVFNKEIRIPLSQKGMGVHWYRFSTELSYNPETEDLEVFAYFDDIDNEVRLEHVVEKILVKEYEYLCQIDIQSGYITEIGINNESKIPKSMNGKVAYGDVYAKALERILSPESLQEGLEAMSPRRIREKLATSDTYSCIFPVVLDDGRGKRICRWSFEFIDAMKSTVLMTRANISELLEYGYDTLTGLVNRNGFYRHIRSELDRKQSSKYYILELDFDNFKLINEEYGYDEGNRILRRFAMDLKLMANKLGKGCWAGHFEADVFAFLLPLDCDISPEKFYACVAKQLASYPNSGCLKLRMGVYSITDTNTDVVIMCDSAHLAHKACKASVTSYIEYYSEALRYKLISDRILLSEMQNALDTEQFEVWFQPQVNHSGRGKLVGAEALVRWRHPKRGLIPPGVFIPLFENNGTIYELDKYVWRHACIQLRKWLDSNHEPVPISVNVSRIDILQSDFLTSILDIVNEYAIPYYLLHLEVTESAFSDDAGEVASIVKELISLGFTVAIDDFGSGYSSLSLLESVPAHVLKLDMRFFRNNSGSLRNECIIESVIRMAKMLGMAVLAEGVEHVEQADFLGSVGCDYIQGYLYSKPLPLSEYEAYSKRPLPEISGSHESKPHTIPKNEHTPTYELFRNIITGSNDIVVVSDIDTKRVLYANRAAEQFYKKTFDPMSIMNCSDFCAGKSDCENCPVNNLKPEEREERILNYDNVYLKSLYTRINWNGHDAFVFYQMDISNEMLELELSDSLVRNIPGALVTYAHDENGMPELKYVSEQAQKVFAKAGIESEKPTYMDCFAITHPDDRERIMLAAKATFRDKKPFREEFRIVYKDGSDFWIELIVNPVLDKSGNYQYYGIYTDITDRKLIELGKFESDKLLNIQELLNIGLRESMLLKTPEASINYTLGLVGKILEAERTYVVEKNADGTDSNTFEWCAEGVSSEIDNLQNVPGEICACWYERFKGNGLVVINDLEDIRKEYPSLYELLHSQSIHSIIAVPFFNNLGEPMGFFGMDNPPADALRNYPTLAQNIAFYIEATLKRRNLEKKART